MVPLPVKFCMFLKITISQKMLKRPNCPAEADFRRYTNRCMLSLCYLGNRCSQTTTALIPTVFSGVRRTNVLLSEKEITFNPLVSLRFTPEGLHVMLSYPLPPGLYNYTTPGTRFITGFLQLVMLSFV